MKTGDTLYQHIYDKLMEDIANGIYADGRQLPTEMELAKTFFVSRITS